MLRLLRVQAVILLLLLIACGGDGQQQDTRQAAAPDTAARAAVEQPAQPAATRLTAQRAWDTADSNSFDVEEANRRRRDEISPSTFPPIKLDSLRIKPSDHPLIPQKIAAWLEQRGYVIPQSTDSRKGKLSNVLTGSFVRKGEKDLALLASNESMVDLLVFENTATDSIHTVKRKVAEHWIKYAAIDSVALLAFEIQTVGSNYILEHFKAHGGPEPPDIKHEAINFYLIERASTVYYNHEGEWLRLQGAD